MDTKQWTDTLNRDAQSADLPIATNKDEKYYAELLLFALWNLWYGPDITPEEYAVGESDMDYQFDPVDVESIDWGVVDDVGQKGIKYPRMGYVNVGADPRGRSEYLVPSSYGITDLVAFRSYIRDLMDGNPSWVGMAESGELPFEEMLMDMGLEGMELEEIRDREESGYGSYSRVGIDWNELTPEEMGQEITPELLARYGVDQADLLDAFLYWDSSADFLAEDARIEWEHLEEEGFVVTEPAGDWFDYDLYQDHDGNIYMIKEE